MDEVCMGSSAGYVIPVVMSGGVGSRLWPLSREMHPKPFIKLPDGQTLLQKTLQRALRLPNVAEIVTVTREELYFQTLSIYESLENVKNHEDDHTKILSFILEPFSKNTAPAIALTALQLEKNYSLDTVMAVLPSDHLIAEEVNFLTAATAAIKLAKQGYLVTLGLKPKHAESAFGYLEIDEKEIVGENSYRVNQFREKPDRRTAQRYLESGKHYWNAGIFFFSIATILQELKKHCGNLLLSLQATLSQSFIHEAQRVLRIHPENFTNIPNISLDYALMEKSKQVAMVVADFEWSDIGSWNALSDLMLPDNAGNRTSGDVHMIDTHNCIIKSDKRVVGAIGLNNLAIVDTQDALLIAERNSLQHMKQLVEQLKIHHHAIIKTHQRVERPWGYFIVLAEGAYYKIKLIEVLPNAAISLQSHQYRSEHWVIINGTAKAIVGEKVFFLQPNEAAFVPVGVKHRVMNDTDKMMQLIEVQCGSYFGEDDIVRYEDKYNRVKEEKDMA